jgi:hypothetical protein
MGNMKNKKRTIFTKNNIARWEAQLPNIFRQAGLTPKHDFSFRLQPLPVNPHRADTNVRRHFVAIINEIPTAFIVMGNELNELHKKTIEFTRACPSLACKCLFYKTFDGIECLAQEYFSGSNLDDGWQKGLYNERQVIYAVRKVFKELDATLGKGSGIRRALELDRFLKRYRLMFCRNPLDENWLNRIYRPFLQKGLLKGPALYRWTNGDVVTRNILLDSKGRVRLVDYEFSECTHFYMDDYARLLEFTDIPKEILLKAVQNRYKPNGSLILFFWMRQGVMVNKVNKDK